MKRDPDYDYTLLFVSIGALLGLFAMKFFHAVQILNAHP